jgi:hypothetical protein
MLSASNLTNERLDPGDKISITIERLNNSEVTLDVEILWRMELYTASFSYGYGVKALNPKATLQKV